jgi:hypothetical protein
MNDMSDHRSEGDPFICSSVLLAAVLSLSLMVLHIRIVSGRRIYGLASFFLHHPHSLRRDGSFTHIKLTVTTAQQRLVGA